MPQLLYFFVHLITFIAGTSRTTTFSTATNRKHCLVFKVSQKTARHRNVKRVHHFSTCYW